MPTDPRFSLLHRLMHFIDRVVMAGMYAAGLCVAGILASYSTEVFMRYLLDSPTSWASDFVKYFLCGAVFLAMPQLTRDGSHVAVNVLKGRLPIVLERMAVKAGLAITAMTCFAVGWLAVAQTLYNFNRDIETMSLVAIPKWVVSAPIAYGFIISGVVVVTSLFSPAIREETL